MTAANSDCQLILQLQQQPEIFERIQNSQQSELKLQQALRREFSPDLVRAAMTLVELGIRATAKFTRAEQMWFDRKGLEQATPEQVAQHKAARFSTTVGNVIDLCCGIGSDSIAIAATGKQIESVDLSAASGMRMQLNAVAYGVSNRIHFQQGDAKTAEIGDRLVHIDPDRRQGQRRAVRLEDYEPSLEFMQELTERCRGGAIKLSPASNFGGKFSNCEIELISLSGECKEATVWFGDLATEKDWRATILPSGYTITANPGEHYPVVSELAEYLYDPDPAIVRAGLVDAIVDELGIRRVDDAEEYLTSDVFIESPAIAAFRVIANVPNNTKEIRKYFRDHPVGEVEIKCRHVPTNADQLRKKLPLNGAGRATLFIARLRGKTRAIIAQRQSDL